MEKINIEGLKETIYYEKLPSGLDVYLWKNEKVNSFFASLNVNFGSIHTEFKNDDSKKNYIVPNGVAHFLEHLNFKLKGGASAQDIFDKLGSDINAFTTFEYTSYHVTATTNLEENINGLLDYVYTPYFTKKLVSNERGIILEEAKSGLDNPSNILFYKRLENLLINDKRKNRVIGSLDDIKNISFEDICLCYDTFYHPQNMFMIVTGNIDIYKTFDCIKKNMAKKEFDSFKNPIIKKIKESNKIAKEYEEIEANVEIPSVSVSIKIPVTKIPPNPKENILISWILRANFGSSSEFKNDMIDEKIMTSLSSSRMTVTDNLIITINALTKYPDEALKQIKNKLKNLELSKEDFERTKKVGIAELIFLYEDPENVNMNIQDDIIYSSNHKILNDIKIIYENLTYDEALKVLKNIKDDNMSIVIMKPNKK